MFQISRTLLLLALGVTILLSPLQCFNNLGGKSQVMSCCAKGKCLPTRNSDGCCKNTSPNSAELSAPVAKHAPAPLVLSSALIPAPVPAIETSIRLHCDHDDNESPPGALSSNVNLPLLI